VSKGVAADHLVANGYGPDKKVADNATPEGRAQNRRVQFNILLMSK
jgi:OOP family OmpA-OmpF porin